MAGLASAVKAETSQTLTRTHAAAGSTSGHEQARRHESVLAAADLVTITIRNRDGSWPCVADMEPPVERTLTCQVNNAAEQRS